MENQTNASASLPSALRTSANRPSPIAHSTSGGGRTGRAEAGKSIQKFYPRASAPSPADAYRKIWRAAATILAVMEDPTPPAESDGPPPAAGGGVPPAPAPGPADWVDAVQRHGRWLRRVILTRLGEPQAVEEVMQEVSLAAVATSAAGGTAGTAG